MTDPDDRWQRELERQAAALPREIMPARDLWPGIAMRLSQRPEAGSRRRGIGRWPWLPTAGALVAGSAFAIWMPLPRLIGGSALPVVPTAATLVENIQPALAHLPAKTRAVVEADLTGLERDRERIEQALAEDPGNPLLQELQMSTADRAESLRAQMNRLAGPSTEGIDI